MQDNKLIKALVLNAQLGNNSAFEQLYEMTIEQIYALVLRLTGNSMSAETLTKDSYVNAWQKISKKDEHVSFLSWLKKIAVQTVVQEKVDSAPTSKSSGNHPIFSEAFENLIRNLEPKSRWIYVLHDVDNFSIEEISKLLGVREEEIKAALANTRENLIKQTEE